MPICQFREKYGKKCAEFFISQDYFTEQCEKHRDIKQCQYKTGYSSICGEIIAQTSNLCAQHMCQAEKCKEKVWDSKFCIRHKCFFCRNQRENDETPTCISCRCPIDGCHSPLKNRFWVKRYCPPVADKFCEYHVCSFPVKEISDDRPHMRDQSPPCQYTDDWHKDKDSKAYCIRHKCLKIGCDRPIVAKNTRENPTGTVDGDIFAYSFYCEEHTCAHKMHVCIEPKVEEKQACCKHLLCFCGEPAVDELRYSGFCQAHKCIKLGCDQKIFSDKDKTCRDHAFWYYNEYVVPKCANPQCDKKSSKIGMSRRHNCLSKVFDGGTFTKYCDACRCKYIIDDDGNGCDCLKINNNYCVSHVCSTMPC